MLALEAASTKNAVPETAVVLSRESLARAFLDAAASPVFLIDSDASLAAMFLGIDFIQITIHGEKSARVGQQRMQTKKSTGRVDFDDFSLQQCILCGGFSTPEEWWTTWLCLPPCKDQNCGFKGKDVCYECGSGVGQHDGFLHSQGCPVYANYQRVMYNSKVFVT